MQAHRSKVGWVEYDIVLSQVYSVPVLYFQLSIDSRPATLDEIYKHLVAPSGFEKAVKHGGVWGAISQGVSGPNPFHRMYQ